MMDEISGQRGNNSGIEKWLTVEKGKFNKAAEPLTG